MKEPKHIGQQSYTDSPIPDNVHIANYTQIGSGVVFVDCEHPSVSDRKVVANYPFNEKLGQVGYPKCTSGVTLVGNDVWIGDGAIIKDGVTIENGAIIGAGAVITKNVAPFEVVVGNPQRIVRLRFTPKQIHSLQKICWWDWSRAVVESRVMDFINIDSFIKKYV